MLHLFCVCFTSRTFLFYKLYFNASELALDQFSPRIPSPRGGEAPILPLANDKFRILLWLILICAYVKPIILFWHYRWLLPFRYESQLSSKVRVQNKFHSKFALPLTAASDFMKFKSSNGRVISKHFSFLVTSTNYTLHKGCDCGRRFNV